MNKRLISIIFIITGIYDGILGLLFLVVPSQIFNLFKTTPPNHFGYVQFAALILITFGIMFFTIAKNPLKNRDLIPFGIMLKVSYCGVVFGYWFFSGISTMFKPFAVIDLIFAILFIIIYLNLKKEN